MKSKNVKVCAGFLLATACAMLFSAFRVSAEEVVGEWREENGNSYWYENGIKQGLEGRGKEIYDSNSKAWYWLDSVDDGRKATNKDVYQKSLAGAWGDIIGTDGQKYGKWVRYDENGHMVKGWNTNEKGTYYFDEIYGTMAKGYATIEGKEYFFNEGSGVLEKELGEVPQNGWKKIDGNDYWYENSVRQGYSIDDTYRGKEIYDPISDAWYWLDNVDDGKKAISKDVYQESLAGDWGDVTGTDGQKYGKWVRYDAEGHMIKGWSTNEKGTYYFDLTYGTMAKGEAEIEGKIYSFNVDTGICEGEKTNSKEEVTEQETEKQETEEQGTEIHEASIKHSGELGDVSWKITNDCLLVVTGQCAEDGVIPKTYWFEAAGVRCYAWFEYKDEITSAYVDVKGIKDLSDFFSGMTRLEKVDLTNLDTSNVRDMSLMFNSCENLKSLDLSGFDTSNVTDMCYMFAYCPELISLDISSFDTSNVTDMMAMFDGCKKLKQLDISSFDTSNVTDMWAMFSRCHELTSLDLRSFDTINVTDMGVMFSECNNLKEILVGSNWKMADNVDYMFYNCGTNEVTLKE